MFPVLYEVWVLDTYFFLNCRSVSQWQALTNSPLSLYLWDVHSLICEARGGALAFWSVLFIPAQSPLSMLCSSI